MALPTILVNSATGSDTAASGAGPGTALTGAAGVSAADGLSVDLSADAPDLTGVAIDGSHVLFFNDTNAGSRNFAKITGADNGTKIVTVSDAVRASQTKAWAIGGKRSAIGTTLSEKLFDNNGAAGDAMPGWTVEMESGHAETIAATFDCRRAGTTALGPITLKGTSGAATRPILTFSNNGNAIVQRGNYQVFKDFDMVNTNATKTASVALVPGPAAIGLYQSIKVSDSTNKFWKAVVDTLDGHIYKDCEFGYCASIGVDLQTGITNSPVLINNWIHDCGSHGITASNLNAVGYFIYGNLLTNNVGDGFRDNCASTSLISGPRVFMHNTCEGNDSDGLEITAVNTNLRSFGGLIIANNIFSNNGAYGINFSGASVDATLLNAFGVQILNNDFFGNGTAPSNPATINDVNSVTTDPTFTDSGSNDYSVGTNMKALGYPIGGTLNVGKGSSTKSYIDIGTAQRQEAAAGNSFFFVD